MKSITSRMTVGYALAVTLAVTVALAAGRWLLAEEMTAGMDRLHEAEFREVLQQLGAQPETLSRAELTRKMAEHSAVDENLFFFQVNDSAGTVFFRSPNLGDTLLPDHARPGEPWVSTIPLHGRIRGMEFHSGSLHFQIGGRLAPMDRVLSQYVKVSGVLVAIAGLVSLGLGYGLSRLALRPIQAIAGTARRIGADNLGERIPVPPGGDEGTALVVLLNAMFDRLEGSFRQIARFSAEASHELKTPLTLIRLNVERLRARVAASVVTTDEVDGVLEEIASMERVINHLLFLAKAEGGALPLQRAERPTGDFLSAVVEDALVLAEDAGLRLALTRNDAGEVRFDQGLMRQVLLNLVNNAVAATPRGGLITLASWRAEGNWHLEVVDDGAGVAPDQLERMFERFAQLPSSGAGAKKGSGLGLAICRGIVQLHGGRITASLRSDRPGMRMRVEIPA